VRPWATWSGDRVARLGIAEMLVQESAVGPLALPGGRVGVQRAADDQPGRGDLVDAEQVAVGERAAGFPRLNGVVVAGADDQVPGAGLGAVGDPDRGPGRDDAEADQVLADTAGQFPAERVIGGDQQYIGAVQGQRQVVGSGGVHHLLRVPAGDPGMLVVLGQHGDVPVAEPQAGRLFPGSAEPDRLGQLHEAQRPGEQGQAAAAFHLLELLGIAGQDHLGAAGGRRLADPVGQVRIGNHRGLVDQEEVAGLQRDGAARAALPGQMAQELRARVALGHADGQRVAGRLGRRDPDDPPEPRVGPRLAGRGQHPRLSRPGRRVDHRDAPAVSQHRQRGRGLIHAQPGPRAHTKRVARVLRMAGQRGLELSQVRAQQPRSRGAVHARRAVGARQRDHAFFHGQLRVRGKPHAAVPLVDATPVRTQQAARKVNRFGRAQARLQLELRRQRPVRNLFQQGGGLGRVHAGAGQHPAQELDHIRPGKGALVLLRQRDRLLRRPAHLHLTGPRAGTGRAARARGGASCAGMVPH
jgi:hypothetical protein